MWRLFRPQRSPVLPLEINASLQELLTLAAFPDLSRLSRDQVDELRHWMIYGIDEYINADSNGRALMFVDTIWRDRSDFCLYLRDFALAGTAMEERTIAIVSRPGGDLEFQRALESAAGDCLPILGLSNFVDPMPIGPMIKLYVRNWRWLEVIIPLVAAASVIVINVGDMSEGVQVELEIIRQLDRRDVTLVLSDRQETPLPADFAHTILWQDEDTSASSKVLSAAIAHICDVGRKTRLFGRLVLDPPLPPSRVRRASRVARRLWMERAERLMAGKRVPDGKRVSLTNVEDALAAAFAMSCWEANHIARAETLWQLGVVQMIRASFSHDRGVDLGLSDFATSNLARAVTIIEFVIERRPDALNVLHEADRLLAKFREYGGKRIAGLIDRVHELRSRNENLPA